MLHASWQPKEKNRVWVEKWLSHSSHTGHSLASKRRYGGQRGLANMAWREAAGIGCLKDMTSDRNMSYTYLCSDRPTGVFKPNRAWRLSAKLPAWQGRFVQIQHYTEYVCGAWHWKEPCVLVCECLCVCGVLYVCLRGIWLLQLHGFLTAFSWL